MPVTILTGTADEQAPLELAHEAARSAPKGRVMPLTDLGHYALVEDPVACASAVNALWGRA
jgi:pimeloyl-ACP methyl ester carboxylesterase